MLRCNINIFTYEYLFRCLNVRAWGGEGAGRPVVSKTEGSQEIFNRPKTNTTKSLAKFLFFAFAAKCVTPCAYDVLLPAP